MMGKHFLILVLSLSLSSVVLSDSENLPAKLSDRESYISVTVDFNGLDESAVILKEATAALSKSFKQAAESPGDLSVEQMQELGKLIEKSAGLVDSLQRTTQAINPAIKSAQQPANEFLSTLLQTTQAETIEPTVESIETTVQSWMLIAFLGAVLIITILGLSFYYSTRQIREFAKTLKSISSEYEIVRRQ